MTITQGYPWAISKVMGFEKPTWSLSLFNSFEDTVTKISSKSTTDKQVMCVWEHKIIKEQDQNEGRPDRNYEPDVELWKKLEWQPLDPASNSVFTPLIGIAP